VIGRVPVSGLLRQVDLFALPYRLTIGQAAYPGLVLEAMATGVPMVTTDHPLLRELIEPGKEAELAKPEDSADLAQSIVRLLDNPVQRMSMLEAQRNLMRSAFDPDRLAARYEEIYNCGDSVHAGSRR
jgi:colanic acid/amylovoran biosynthesis glycosyltransferase